MRSTRLASRLIAWRICPSSLGIVASGAIWAAVVEAIPLTAAWICSARSSVAVFSSSSRRLATSAWICP